jgi:hypothetical protein
MRPSLWRHLQNLVWPALLSALLCAPGLAWPEDFAALCADRTAIERVYYQHRLGNKPPFEETMSPAQVEKLVREDLHKQAVLEQVYAIAITSALLAAEVQRINATTRAPDVLAELKSALGNDNDRFGRTVAQPLLIERVLREKFENDDALHAQQRERAEDVRSALLAARTNHYGPDRLLALFRELGSNQVTEATWLLQTPPDRPQNDRRELIEAQKRFGPNAQLLSSPRTPTQAHDVYFEELPPGLQRVLRAQLRQPGDVSAIIELPSGFQLYLCQSNTAAVLKAAALSVPKRSYDLWLSSQP